LPVGEPSGLTRPAAVAKRSQRPGSGRGSGPIPAETEVEGKVSSA